MQKYNLKKSSKRNQNPSRYYNFVTKFLEFRHKPKLSSFKNPDIKIDLLLLPQEQKSHKLLYSVMNLNTISFLTKARPIKNSYLCIINIQSSFLYYPRSLISSLRSQENDKKFHVLLGVYLFCTDGVQARDIEVSEKDKKKKGSSTAMWQLARQTIGQVLGCSERMCFPPFEAHNLCSLSLSLSLSHTHTHTHTLPFS